MESFPILETDRLRLRQIVESDAEDLYSFRSDAEAERFNGGPMKSMADSIKLIGELEKGFEEGTGLHWGLTILGREDRIVGLFGFSHTARLHHRSEVGYDLARPFWGNGYAFEAMQAILQFGFSKMDLNRIYAVPYTANLRSMKLLDRLGFTLEGIHRQEHLLDGKFYDESIYSLLRTEFNW